MTPAVEERLELVRLRESVTSLAQLADEYAEILRRNEWHGWLEKTGERACPECLFPQSGGVHSKTCKLHEAIRCPTCGDTGTYETYRANGASGGEDVPVICSCAAGDAMRRAG